MIKFTVHAIDSNAANVLGASFNWGGTGSFTYDEMGTAVLTLIIPDNDTKITNLNNGVSNSNPTTGLSSTPIPRSGGLGLCPALMAPALSLGGYGARASLLATSCSRKTWWMGLPIP